MNYEVTKLKYFIAASTIAGLGAVGVGTHNMTREPVLTDTIYRDGRARVIFHYNDDSYEMNLKCTDFMSILLIRSNSTEDVGFTHDKVCDDGSISPSDESEIIKRAASIVPRSIF